MLPRRTLLVVVVLLVALGVTTSGAGAAESSGTTLTPASGGQGTPFIAGTSFDLASVGYQQSEYLFGGTASAYTSATPLTSDGKWKVTPTTTAPFTTRLLVYRPADPKDFNGTVIVEWNNVSSGIDAAPIWLAAHDELIREGYAWVGVTAQKVGVEGGVRAIVPNLDLKHRDPERYGGLVHPGDSYSYDMYRQAGVAVRSDATQLPRWTEAEARDRRGRVAVGVPDDHVHRRHRADQQGCLRRLLRLQPRRQRRRALPGTRARPDGTVAHAHPRRPHGPGDDVHHRDRPDLARLPPGAPARHQALPRLGGGRHLTRRQLHPHRRHDGQRAARERRGHVPDHARPTERHLQRHHQVRLAVQHGTDDLRAARVDRRAATRGSSTAPRHRRRRGSRPPATPPRRSRSTPTAT